MSAKFQALRWVNVTDLGSVSGASYVIVDRFIFAIFFAVALHKKPGSLRNLCLLSLHHFVCAILLWVWGFVPAVTAPLSSHMHSVVIMDERKNRWIWITFICFSRPSVISDVILGLSILFIFEIVKPGMSSRTHGRISQTKWPRKWTQSSTDFETSRRFGGVSIYTYLYILIATVKEKWQCGMSMIYLRLRLNSGLTFSQHNARNFANASDLLDKL